MYDINVYQQTQKKTKMIFSLISQQQQKMQKQKETFSYICLFSYNNAIMSMFKAIFSNPGYCPSPLELEYKILSI